MKYRNDAGAPASPDHIYHLGVTEWQDVQAGVRYALAHSASDVILYGYSMGGGVVEYFLHHSPYAGRVRAVVLDSPALDWNAVLDLQANQRSLPGILTVVGKRIVAYRLGLSNLDPLDATRSAASLRAPTLLFQGTKDTTIPVGPSAAFARARPDIVTYVVVPGAEHTQPWNVDPAAYDARLKAFLNRVLR
jgi:pimeloyl-ACP methyl ester carboxylesterase